MNASDLYLTEQGTILTFEEVGMHAILAAVGTDGDVSRTSTA
jgi:hypothetical protein